MLANLQPFYWGVSTAAYQIEGAHNSQGKGASIWDVFTKIPGKIYSRQNANTSCDFYHQYYRDIALMSQMNIPNFRFSLSWSRLFPSGTGMVNPKGVEFYNKVIDFCLDLNIEPWITLYHWDLPYELELKGGWTNREIINWFTDYVQKCIRLFGDRVKHWLILNEPMVFTGAGYFLGVHAPGKRGLNNFLAAAHHAALCQAEGTRAAKACLAEGKIGTTFSCSLIEPNTSSEQDASAAKRVDALINRMFIEPLCGLGYPVKDLKLLNRLEPFIKDGDEAKLKADVDFIGVQNYTRELISHSYTTPLLWAKVVKASKRNVTHTVMDWEVYPASIYNMLKRFNEYGKKMIVTENGAAFPDEMINGRVHDTERTDYLKQHIAQVLKARQEGINVHGYFVWSLMDNFEWAEGYHPRFGLVHVDYSTLKRTIKDSGHWYASFIESQRLSHPLYSNSAIA